MAEHRSGFDAIVLAGGRGVRMQSGAPAGTRGPTAGTRGPTGGNGPASRLDIRANDPNEPDGPDGPDGSDGPADKLSFAVGDTTLLDRALGAVGGARTVVVVGPRRPIALRPTASRSDDEDPELIWTREDPPGAGPAAAIVHGLTFVRRPIVVVVAGDMPFTATAVPRLLAAIGGHDAAMLIDDAGRRQPLIAAYVTDALRARGAAANWANRSVRSLVEGLDAVAVPAAANEALDCDTPDDLVRARSVAAATAETSQEVAFP